MKMDLVILEGIYNKELQQFGSKLVLPATSLVVAGFHISQFAYDMLNEGKNNINYGAQEKMLQRIYNCYLIYLVSRKNKDAKWQKWFELGYNLSSFKKVILPLNCGSSSSYYNKLVNNFIKYGVVVIEEKTKLAVRKWKDQLDQNTAINIYKGVKYWNGEKNEDRK